MIKLSKFILEQDQGNYFDWMYDFNFFKNTINTSTETAKNRLERSLSSKVLNRSVIVRASKSQPKQPQKDYTINKVTNVSVVNYYDEWTVVLKDEYNKEFCLIPGYKIKVIGAKVAPEPGTASTPTKPEPAVPKSMSQPMQQKKPTRPLKSMR